MSIRKIEFKRIVTHYFDICEKCKKRIEGITAGQVKYNMKVHKEAKHNQESKGGTQ